MQNAIRSKLRLFDHAVGDPEFKMIERAQSRRWYYHTIVPHSLSGFNPLTGAAYYARESQLACWLKSPEKPPRDFNEADFFIKEILFCIHDYLHAWAYRAINELCPRLGFGTTPITKENFENFVFCHLLTETAATVGLDYWYLAELDLNAMMDMGSTFNTLTVKYHERHHDEYVRFNPKLKVQDKNFFNQLNEFYCSGQFVGYSRRDLKRSQIVSQWLTQEIEYGELQRKFSRLWLAYLSQERINLHPSQLTAPVEFRERWKLKLVNQLGELVWQKVKHDSRELLSFKFDPAIVWQTTTKQKFDFRFVNLNALKASVDEQMHVSAESDRSNFDYFFFQLLSQYSFENFDRDLIKLIPCLLKSKDVNLVRSVFRGQKKLRPSAQEPFNLFFLN